MDLQRRNVSVAVIMGLVVMTAVFFKLVHPVASQGPGFINIDCGGGGGGLWEPDSKYLHSVNELITANVTINATVRWKNSENFKTTARVFIPSRTSPSKYCYHLNAALYNSSSTEEQVQYLLRVEFPSRNLFNSSNNVDTLTAKYTTRFFLVVDSTDIATINLDFHKPQTVELIINPVDENIYVCLMPPPERKSSLVAISSLELRPLEKGMYERNGAASDKEQVVTGPPTTTTYLMMVSRLDFGGLYTTLRYPDDRFDRIWTSPEVPNETQFRNYRNATGLNETAYDRLPSKVLDTAWEGTNLNSEISFPIDINAAKGLRRLQTFYLTFWFRDINPRNTGKGSRRVDVLRDGKPWAFNISVSTGNFMLYSLDEVLENPTSYFTIVRNQGGRLPPILNAFELYAEFAATRLRTAASDAGEIQNFSSIFSGQLDTAGDPCLPNPWNWLVCSIETIPEITQINLTGKGVPKGNETLLDRINFGNFGRLTMLDVSHNGFSGNLTKSLELATSLNTVDLSNNNFSGSVPEEFGNLTNLKSLDLSFNNLTDFKIDLGSLSKLTDLNLANNRLEGTVPASVWSSSVLNVNLTNNEFKVLNLSRWIDESHGFQGLEKRVRLLNNQIAKVYPDPPPGTFYSLLQLNDTGGPNFVLLGNDSPWCVDRAGKNATTFVKHLCRASEFDPLDPDDDNVSISKRTIIIIGLVSGISGLLMISLFLLSLWRIRKRHQELRRVQEELEKQDVWPPMISYDELRTATKGFSQECELGRGAFAAVYKAELLDGTKVAVKKLFTEKQEIADFVKELVLITGIKHKHLIQLKGCCIRDKQWMLVYEYAENKNLAEALWGEQRSFTLTWAQRMNICLGIARGLQYLLEELHPKIIHRDIKPENILLDKDFNAKIADFGLARNGEENDTQMVTRYCAGTWGYLPPEYATQGMVTDKLDVYSYGILVLEIVAGRRCINLALQETPEQIYLRNWASLLCKNDKLLSVLDKELWGSCPEDEVLLVLKMALACIQEDWTKRPTMNQVVNTLMVNSDITVDIVMQLKKQTPSFAHLIEDDARTSDYKYTVRFAETDSQESALLGSSSRDGGSLQSMIQLTNMNVLAR